MKKNQKKKKRKRNKKATRGYKKNDEMSTLPLHTYTNTYIRAKSTSSSNNNNKTNIPKIESSPMPVSHCLGKHKIYWNHVLDVFFFSLLLYETNGGIVVLYWDLDDISSIASFCSVLETFSTSSHIIDTSCSIAVDAFFPFFSSSLGFIAFSLLG